ncbi:MAG TPA: GNAT family N-acetyltransferase, partial [Limnochordia bacterium]
LCAQTADAPIHGGLKKGEPDPRIPFHIELVAEIDGHLVGFLEGDLCMAPNEKGDVVVVEPWEGYIHTIGVHPHFRRRGIGRRLLLAALHAYAEAGCVRAELCTPSPNAAEFFRRCGGRPIAGAPEGNFEWLLPLRQGGEEAGREGA